MRRREFLRSTSLAGAGLGIFGLPARAYGPLADATKGLQHVYSSRFGSAHMRNWIECLQETAAR